MGSSTNQRFPALYLKKALIHRLRFLGIKKYTAIVCLMGLSACSSTPSSNNVYSAFAPVVAVSSFASEYPILSERILMADGPKKGKDAYQLIREFAGPKSIESPDLYDNNHSDEAHIYENKDELIGNHFVFSLHKLLDKDRGIESIKDRQRNEIKGYKGSNNTLKAFHHEVVAYHWKFKLNDDLSLSENFTHFFQLKGVDAGSGTPLLTITGRDKNGQWLTVNHQNHGKKTVLGKVPLQAVKGRWLQVSLFVDYNDDGQLDLTMTDIKNKRPVMKLSFPHLDMWRGEKSDDFVRPKWGIYRSLRSQDMLQEAEEKVFFADFMVQKRQAPTP